MTQPDSDAAGWYPDPWGKAPWRYWDGSGWTGHISSGSGGLGPEPQPVSGLPVPQDGSEPPPPPSPPEQARLGSEIGGSPVAPSSPSAAEAEALWIRLGEALTAYDALLAQAAAGRLDERGFRQQAIRTGLVVLEDEAWIYDAAAGRWVRYDGVTLQPLQLETGAPAPPGPEAEPRARR